ncbi:DNA replication protein [Clostridium butyricum]|nr:ATP-binding protein [Clostridium butyricum]ALR90249.1 DNA replication protein [Clostridium butyricum]ALS19134.1 DNA replication protein [Clostridium butyricum]ANF16321.1 DNA replication protein [Clostridium butyricum]MCI3010220.1 ATP-binding protein [Clostridium butyricum]MDM8131473.1 ATP-binding protein [Clostridium butyricum]
MILENSLETKESDFQLMTCSKCGDHIQKEINILGKIRIVPVLCGCRQKQLEDKKRAEEVAAKQERIKQLFTSSLMDKKFMNETFENWDLSKGNKGMYNMGISYCNKFSEAKKEGLGFLFHGEPGNGKTYLSNCIGNRLLNNMVPVICVGINQLLERIRQTYSRYGQDGEDTVLRGLALADLLILDDLGTEQSTEWSISRVYNIIDSRIRNGLPIIISTNHTIADLEKRYSKRTISRLTEVCTPIKFTGEDIRKLNAKKKTDLLRQILK